MASKKSHPLKDIHQTESLKSEEKQKDDMMISIINALNILIAQASSTDMGTAARILYNAKEELVHWAVDMNFHESCKDRFINQHLYDSGLHAVGEFISRIGEMKDDNMKNELIRMLGLSLTSVPVQLSVANGKSVES